MQKKFEELGKEAMKYATPNSSEENSHQDSEPSKEESNESAKEEDIVDADFEVVDESDDKSEK